MADIPWPLNQSELWSCVILTNDPVFDSIVFITKIKKTLSFEKCGSLTVQRDGIMGRSNKHA